MIRIRQNIALLKICFKKKAKKKSEELKRKNRKAISVNCCNNGISPKQAFLQCSDRVLRAPPGNIIKNDQSHRKTFHVTYMFV